MAKLYWVSFRISDPGRDERYEALRQVLWDCGGGEWWEEPTSFTVFKSGLSIAQISKAIGTVIDRELDVVVVGMPEVKSARVIGAVDDEDLFKLWPWIQPD